MKVETTESVLARTYAAAGRHDVMTFARGLSSLLVHTRQHALLPMLGHVPSALWFTVCSLYHLVLIVMLNCCMLPSF